ncbi:DUF456 domain-containing protein [Nocardioides jiangxiensis]|uniref:DUF456 domain-containing protein n=1 Tax=Nocardioides jiangxiensis TaxID=3064524 RepID=A0ABT9B3K0_9ACTN|nr:DUF456 domain-containing protein [Nocardioides sp. WY-20]MDO7869435.1 DUF456 domain-containing protein [Nocardioides sp. WY-20]
MDFRYDLIFLLLTVVGLVGILVPVLPGTILIACTSIGWAATVGVPAAWWVAALVVALSLTGTFLQYAVPGRRLQSAGVPRSTLLVGALTGVVGFFVVPVVGLPLGFVLGVFLAESRRIGPDAARSRTWSAVKAVGLSMLIELAFALASVTALVVGMATT